jgi:hypothetical protein
MMLALTDRGTHCALRRQMSGTGAIFLILVAPLIVAAWWLLAGMVLSIFRQTG